ncbi:hypothetical protein BGZ60DRAFT_459662 [Tricladium varicosporioides]|nr:hypothetical protein BGZ60DRAFT_459662 [Hymenoscyphus varicosporioides]
MRFFKAASAFLALSVQVIGQTLTPFQVDGYLDVASMTVRSAAANSGGSVTVNGFVITIPDNLQILFPAAFVTWQNLFLQKGTFGGDVGHEISIVGNIVTTGTGAAATRQAIAGQVTLSGLFTELSTGFIQSIDYTTGEIKIVDGPIMRINDPVGRFGKASTLGKDFFAVDSDNPSVTAFSGFPMCVPRVAPPAIDPLCPQGNRPTVAGSNPVAFQTFFEAPNTTVMAPFQVGDYLEYSGIMVGGKIYSYNVVANLEITTPPGIAPAYLRIEAALIGVLDPDPAVEVSQSKIIGFCTDPTATIDISAVIRDPCTGADTDRLIVPALPVEATIAGGRNRARFRWLSDRAAIGDYSREYHLTISSGQKVTANGINAGQYHAPVTEWVFPELFVIGAIPYVFDFTHFTDLASGYGPLDFSGAGQIGGPLTPWPGRNPVPTPSKTGCVNPYVPPGQPSPTPGAPQVPITATAGPDITTRPGTFVSITASNTAPGVSVTDLAFLWTEITNPLVGNAVTITNGNTANVVLTFPLQGTIGTLVRTFQVKISHISGSTSTATVKVTTDSTVKDVVVIDSYTRINSGGGTITVNAHTNLVADPAAGMSIVVTGNPAVQQMTKVGTGTGKFTFTSVGVKAGTPIVVTSTGGGTATLPGAAKRDLLDPNPSQTRDVDLPNRAIAVRAPTPIVAVVSASSLVTGPGTFITLSVVNGGSIPVRTQDLSYAWVEKTPVTPLATITNAKTAQPTVTFPLQGTIGILVRTFQVTMTHKSGSSNVATIQITTNLDTPDIVVIDSWTSVKSGGGTVTITAHTNLVNDPNASMTVQIDGFATLITMDKVPNQPGKFTMTQVRLKPAGGITCTSSGGGSASAAAPFKKREIAFTS